MQAVQTNLDQFTQDAVDVVNQMLRQASEKNDYTRIKIKAMDSSPDGRTVVVAYVRSGVDRNLIDEKAGDTTKQKDSVWETHVVLIDATDGAIKKDTEEVRDGSVTTVVFAPPPRLPRLGLSRRINLLLPRHTY